jgi:hypothetical protein
VAEEATGRCTIRLRLELISPQPHFNFVSPTITRDLWQSVYDFSSWCSLDVTIAPLQLACVRRVPRYPSGSPTGSNPARKVHPPPCTRAIMITLGSSALTEDCASSADGHLGRLILVSPLSPPYLLRARSLQHLHLRPWSVPWDMGLMCSLFQETCAGAQGGLLNTAFSLVSPSSRLK